MVTFWETVQQPTVAEYDTAGITHTKFWHKHYFHNPYKNTTKEDVTIPCLLINRACKEPIRLLRLGSAEGGKEDFISVSAPFGLGPGDAGM
jgi:hypothetical protein